MLRSVRLLLPALLLALLVAAPVLAAQKGVVTDLTWDVDQATQERTAQAMATAGAEWVRMNVGWRWMEPTKGSYDADQLAKVDRAVALSRQAGARILMYADQAPEWASGSSDVRYPPKDPADLAAFYTFLAERYASSVDAWEVWNEPNHPNYWQPDPRNDPDACLGYTALLRAVHPVIREEDPGAPVVFGGLAWNDYAYLERCFELDPGIGAFFDVMNTHPYALGAAEPERIQDESPQDGRLDFQTFLAYREVRASLEARGHTKPIWLTEFGWSTSSDGHSLGNVTPETQADYLTRAYRLLEQDAYVEVATWYSLRNAYSGNDGPGWLDQLGLMKTDFTPKPAYSAFRDYVPPGAPSPQDPGADPSPVPPAGTAAPEPPKPGEFVVVRPGQTRGRVSLRVRRLRHRGRRQVVQFSGRVTGTAAGAVRLRLERRSARGRWRTIHRLPARIGRTGRFQRRVALRGGARWRAHAGFSGSQTVSAAASRYVRFRTRPVRR